MSGCLSVCLLQVLCVNIWALVRHVSQCPQHLTALQELHVDMVGGLSGTDLDPGGLTTLPHLTKLVMTLDTKVRGGGGVLVRVGRGGGAGGDSMQ